MLGTFFFSLGRRGGGGPWIKKERQDPARLEERHRWEGAPQLNFPGHPASPSISSKAAAFPGNQLCCGMRLQSVCGQTSVAEPGGLDTTSAEKELVSA